MTTHTTHNETKRAFYLYTPEDGNEDGMSSGYTLSEAKEIARHRANDLRRMGLNSVVLVNRIDNGNYEWSCE